ncbi:MAG: hypothetical protein JST16_01160 [Bdellovibrionales bacterium]|nr:hypothetical protein [Bdellovibrionales bacterium]
MQFALGLLLAIYSAAALATDVEHGRGGDASSVTEGRSAGDETFESLCGALSSIEPIILKGRQKLTKLSQKNVPYNRQILENLCRNISPVVEKLKHDAGTDEYRNMFAEYCPGGKPSPTLAFLPRQRQFEKLQSLHYAVRNLAFWGDPQFWKKSSYEGGFLSPAELTKIYRQHEEIERVAYVDFASNIDQHGQEFFKFRERYCSRGVRAGEDLRADLEKLIDGAYLGVVWGVRDGEHEPKLVYGSAETEQFLKILNLSVPLFQKAL